jgi:hypothetical protein
VEIPVSMDERMGIHLKNKVKETRKKFVGF